MYEPPPHLGKGFYWAFGRYIVYMAGCIQPDITVLTGTPNSSNAQRFCRPCSAIIISGAAFLLGELIFVFQLDVMQKFQRMPYRRCDLQRWYDIETYLMGVRPVDQRFCCMYGSIKVFHLCFVPLAFLVQNYRKLQMVAVQMYTGQVVFIYHAQ